MKCSAARAFGPSLLIVIVGLAACGTDEPAATTEVSLSVELTTFCDAHLAFLEGVSGDGSEDVDVEALAGDLSATAPADIASTVATFLDVLGRASESGDEAAFVSDEFRDPATELEGYIARNCGYQVVEVSATEYHFDGVPASLSAGPTVFHFVNDGQEIHEGILFRRADGVTGDPITLLATDPSASSGDLEEIGVAFIGEAGDEFYLTTDLQPGAYVLSCFFPQGAKTLADIPADSGDDATHDHHSAGMVVAFDVAG